MDGTSEDRLLADGQGDDAPAPAQDSPASLRRPKRRVRHHVVRVSIWMFAALAVLALAAGFTILALTGKPVALPVWAVNEAEQRLNARIPVPEMRLSLGKIEVMVDRDWIPRLRLEDIRITRGLDTTLLRLPEARVAFDAGSMLRGAIRPSSVVLSGAAVRLRRDTDGRFDLDFGAGAPVRDLGAFPEVLDRIDRVFEAPVLAALREVQVEALSLTLDDRRAGRQWQIGDGQLTVLNTADEVRSQLTFTLANPERAPAHALLSLATRKDSSGARLRATVEAVEARDLAAQAPALGFLSAVDAPISGKVITGLAPDGRLVTLEGELAVAAGALHPSPEARPIAFQGARLAFVSDPKAERVRLDAFEVESSTLRLRATGHIDVPGVTGGLPEAYLAQIAISEVMVDPDGLFTQPVTFGEGAIDLRLRLDPFRLDLGQFTLIDDGRVLSASGSATADARGWRVAGDIALDAIRHDRLMALWPVSAVAKTRQWLVENVQEGLLRNVRMAIRAEQGQEPQLSLGYDFVQGDVRFLKTLPPIRKGSGYATLEDFTYTMVLDEGQITPPLGGTIDMAGSVFSVLDIRHKPAQAEIRLQTDSTLTAALSLLDEEPFRFLTKAGLSVEIGEGKARLNALLRLPLVKKVKPEDVSFDVQGRLQDVRSDVLVEGRTLTSDALAISATPRGLELRGAGKIGEVPFDATYRLPFGKEAGGQSEVEGQVELSPRTIEEFRIGLPKGAVSGSGWGDFRIDMQKGSPARLSLTSKLKGVALSLPEIGWSKPAGGSGTLEVKATLGKPASVEALRLSGAGLEAEGKLSLNGGGDLDRLTLSQVRIGKWFDGPVTLVGRGKGSSPVIEVTGGRLDLRNLPEFGSGKGGNGGGTPITARLDRVQVTETIALHGLTGEFSTAGGFKGSFGARLNGAAALRGGVAPVKTGTAIRITSDDAGGVLAASGIFSTARGGALDLQLVPQGPKGVYEGIATARNFRVRDAPVLAALLSAISVVGILEQLNGEGLVFSSGEAAFRLSPAGVEVRRGSAVGLSMGVSMAGTFDSRTKALNMQGVISPIYLLNGIGAILTRQGEGVFGFNYRITGTSTKPSVSVNPLSLLTPGMFREIFRRPIPQLESQP